MKYEVQVQMKQWGNIVVWNTQAVFSATSDDEAVDTFNSRDDWRTHGRWQDRGSASKVMAGDASRLVRRQGEGAVGSAQVLATAGKPVPTSGDKRRAANAKRRANRQRRVGNR